MMDEQKMIVARLNNYHIDDYGVDMFADAMKEKLWHKRATRSGWDLPECTIEHLWELLREHVGKGDPVDIANISMMIHCRQQWEFQRSKPLVSEASDETKPGYIMDRKDLPWFVNIQAVLAGALAMLRVIQHRDPQWDNDDVSVVLKAGDDVLYT